MSYFEIPVSRQMTDQERFEAWYTRFCGEGDWFRKEPDDPDEYFRMATHDAWHAWQEGKRDLILENIRKEKR